MPHAPRRPRPDRRAVVLGAAALAALRPAGAAQGAAAPAGGVAGGVSGAAPEARALTAAPLTVPLRPPGAPSTAPGTPSVAPSGGAPGAAPPTAAPEAAASGIEVWAFDGALPGPTIRVRLGEEVRLRLVNRTARPLSLHWQGARLANAADGVGGVTAPPVAPGASLDVRFTPPDAGTFLARPLVVAGVGGIGGSTEPAGRGLAALLIVEERTPPAFDREVALLVQDWRVAADGSGLEGFSGRTLEAAGFGRLGNWLSVNGRLAPERIEARPGARVRLRIANACVARAARIRFDGVRAFVAAVDGQPTDAFEPLRATLPFAPGTRYDLVVEMPAGANPDAGALVALVGAGAPLATFAAVGEPLPPGRGPVARLPENRLLPQEIKLQNALRRDLALAGGATFGAGGEPVYAGDPTRIWTVNGAAGVEGMRPLFSVRRGTPVVLAVTNRTAFPQPLHLHGHVFRLLHALDDGWEPYWLDTFQLLEGRTARLAFVADNPGRWLFGSTVLDRFDTGLWTLFEVA